MTGHKNAAAQDSRIEQGQDASQVAPEPVAAVPAPRTDAFHDKWDSYNYPHEAIHFARQLETELHLVTQQHDATIDVLKQTRTELAAAKAERERTLQANYMIREQQKEDFARAEKAEAALAEANRKLAEFEQDALCLKWIEDNETLHQRVEFLYVVDGYEVTLMHENGVTELSKTFRGATIRDAIDALRDHTQHLDSKELK